jgi:hypothetical protein
VQSKTSKEARATMVQTMLWLGMLDVLLFIGYLAFALFVSTQGDFHKTRRWKGALLISALFCIFSLPLIVFFAVLTLILIPLGETASPIENLFFILMLSLAFFLPFTLLMSLGAHRVIGPKDAFLNRLWKDPNHTEVIQTTKAEPVTQAESQQRLMALFTFDMEDLRSNREGKLSDRQKHRYFKDAAFAFFGIFFGGMAVPILFRIFPDDNVPFIFTALVPILLTPIAILAYKLNMRPVYEGVVKYVTGPLTIVPIYLARGTQTISIEDKAFAIHREIIRRLELEATHRIYFTPAYGYILSIERLDSLQK